MSLGILAGCVQRKFVMDSSADHSEQLSLYVGLFAQPGERKSKLFRHMTGPVAEFEKLYKAEQKPKIRANAHRREAMERKINHLKSKLEKNPTPALEAELEQLEATLDDYPVLRETRFYAEDCSSEKLVGLLQENEERLFVISSEGDIFDTINNRYGGVPNLGPWLKGYDGDHIRVDRIVASRLQAKNVTQIKRSELFQSCRGKFFKKAEDLEPVLSLLSEHGYVRLEQPVYTGVGRPKDWMVFVNPEAA